MKSMINPAPRFTEDNTIGNYHIVKANLILTVMFSDGGTIPYNNQREEP